MDLFGGKGGGTPLPRAGFLFAEAAESIKGFRVAVELANDGTVGLVMWALLGFDTPICKRDSKLQLSFLGKDGLPENKHSFQY